MYAVIVVNTEDWTPWPAGTLLPPILAISEWPLWMAGVDTSTTADDMYEYFSAVVWPLCSWDSISPSFTVAWKTRQQSQLQQHQQLYTVSQNNDTDVAHYNSWDTQQPILIKFGRDVAERVCYQMVICYPTSPS